MIYKHKTLQSINLEKIKLAIFGIILQALLFLSILTTVIILSSDSQAMGLKQNAVVEGHVIKLGDIFYDLPKDAEKVLGPAPLPGKDMVLNARTLFRIALALDLPWRPVSSEEQITLRRAATLIDHGMVQDALAEKISATGFPGKFEVNIPVRTSEIILPEDEPAAMEITNLNLDPDRGTFRADISAPSTENPIVRTSISGRIHRIVEVPVLKSTLRNGDVIRERDLEMMNVQAKVVNEDILLSKKDLIGMTPRRMVFAGKPLSENDLQAPQIVARGEAVTMVFQNGALVLTARGRALENGAKGDLIRVVNNSSKRSLDAVVIAENEVSVQEF